MSDPLLPTFAKRSRFAVKSTANARGVELVIYIVAMLWISWLIVKCTWDISSNDVPGLSPGYLFNNRPMDNSDLQYKGFRNNLSSLILLAIAHVCISQLTVFITKSNNSSTRAIPVKLYTSLLLSCIVLFIFYGLDTLKILFFNILFYFITKLTQKQYVAPIMYWIFSVLLLLVIDAFDVSDLQLLSYLGRYKGIGLDWTGSFNFCILRMISFGMDNYWRSNNSEFSVSDHQKHCKDCQELRFDEGDCAKLRIEAPLPESNYNLINFLAYTLYLPLFLAGPIITFNDFITQSRKPSKSVTIYSTFIYGVRWIFLVCLMEIMIHAFHVIAISKARAWDGFTPFQITMVGFWSLKHIWLKLTVIWKFFRLWV